MRLYNQLSVLCIQYTKIKFHLNNRNSKKFYIKCISLKISLFKHFGRQVCMKQMVYPLAHLAAVMLSMFLCRASKHLSCAKFPQWDFLGFGLLRVIHTSLNFGTRDVGFDCRHNVEGGEQTMGREWPDLGGPALPYAQESPTIFLLARERKSPKNRHSIHFARCC